MVIKDDEKERDSLKSTLEENNYLISSKCEELSILKNELKRKKEKVESYEENYRRLTKEEHGLRK